MRARYHKPSGAVKKAIQDETYRQIAEGIDNLSDNITALVLWQLHEQLGFGKKRLIRFHNKFAPALAELQDFYQMHTQEDTDFLLRYKLKEIGVDVEQLDSVIPMKAKINK